MVVADWNAATYPQPLLSLIEGKVSDRKLRLFTTACIRICQGELTSNEDQPVAVMERYVDGLVTADEVDEAWQAPWSDALAEAGRVAQWCQKRRAWPGGTDVEMSTAQATVLRCIVGPFLFRPITLDRAWLTPTVTEIAEAIYDDRAFDSLPALADALEEAGCNNTDILAHCRQQGPHLRGCWVLDLLLGRT
jgi:hypothetical protein